MKKIFVIISIGLAVSLLVVLFTGHWAIISNENNIESSPVIADTNSNDGENSPQTIIVGWGTQETAQSGEIRSVPPFEKLGGKVITRDQLNNFLKAKGLSIYVPEWVPEGLKLTAIWADTSKGIDFPIILVYSDGNDTDYRASENKLIVEIKGIASNFMNETFLEYYVNEGAIPITKNGKLIGVVFEDAYCPTCATQRTLPLAIVKIGNLEYWISYDDVNSIIKLIRSMAQTSAIT